MDCEVAMRLRRIAMWVQRYVSGQSVVATRASLLLCLILVGCSSSQRSFEPSCDVSSAARVSAFAEAKGIPGMAVAVGVRGELVWSYGHGFADLATSSPVVADKTMFRIGSTSKALTAFALARLAEEQRINLDSAILESLPELPKAYEGVTIRQLAGHLGGVRHYNSNAELGSNIEYPTGLAALRIFIDDPLVAPPGQQYAYSTYGYTVLSAVMEAVTDQSYLSFMSETVFSPLGMQRTFADIQSVKIPRRTEFYYLGDDGKPVIGPTINSSYKWAGGGFLSTAVDLARFGMSHFNAELLSVGSRELLWTTQKSVDGRPTGYGLGWFVADRWVQHPGGALGGSTLLRIYPQEEVTIAITANLSMLGPDRFGELPEELFGCATLTEYPQPRN